MAQEKPTKKASFLKAVSTGMQGGWSAPKIILSSFLGILIPSSFLLMLPYFSVTGLSFIDALFTATSAISVTGLGVVDTGMHFNTLGKVLLMLLMQIGGLGQMTLSAVLLYIFGVRMSIKQQTATREELGQGHVVDIRQLVKEVVVFSLFIEAVGMAILATRWVPELGWSEGLFYALFHSISAFNNAGFSFFSGSLSSFTNDPMVTLTISALFILGGLGFTVITDVRRNGLRGFKYLKIHSKIMLTVTPILLLSGTVLLWLIERNNSQTLANLPLMEQWLAAFFQSASARTAGFNSIDLSHLTHPALLIMIILMLVGAGSTSTGGGIKVSTFAVAMVATWSFLRQRDHVVMFKRAISNSLISKSLAIIVVSFILLFIAMFLLMITENAPFGMVMFETISAFATVGLTAGLTETLTEQGKVIMIVVMFIGRIGPLTLAYMLASTKKTALTYPEGKILIG